MALPEAWLPRRDRPIDDLCLNSIASLDFSRPPGAVGSFTEEVRRSVQQQIHGHRRRKHDPLYRIHAPRKGR